MSAHDLAKSYDPQVEEPKVRTRWDEKNPFHADPAAEGERYAIVIPPPNVTASLHLGHALNNSLQDILIRYHRMTGCNVMWMPGTDHAGIATQTVVDKRLRAEGKPALVEYKRIEADGGNGREQFIAKVQAWKDEYEADITEQLKLMGCACDWDRQRFTMDDLCAKSVREAFFRFFKDGLIYRGKRLVNWDPVSQTALADDEVEMEEVDGYFYYLKYPIVDDHRKDTGEYLTVATTRPETMLGDTAVAVNPTDEARKHLIGQRVRLPIVNRVIPIVGDDYVVKPDPESSDPKAKFASGFLKVTPAHDPNDWDLGLRHGLDVINVMAPDGSISREYGWDTVEPNLPDADDMLTEVEGLDRYEAREAILIWMRERGLVEDVKPYSHSVGHSYRSHVPIEPYLSDQWYVQVRDDRLRGAALDAMAAEQTGDRSGYCSAELDSSREELHARKPDQVRAAKADWHGQLRFYPERYAKTFQGWHENLRDWCISRQLWWGHQIPVWSRDVSISFEERAQDIGEITEKSTKWVADGRLAVQYRGEFTEITPSDIKDKHIPNSFFCIRDPEGEDQEIVAYFESRGFVRDSDVLDTWFSSGLWPMSTMGWPHPEDWPNEIPEGSALIDRYNPTTVLSTAREIITLWVSRMVMFNTYFRGTLPFRDVFIHAMIQDGEGRKMSKSLGNGVDPRDIITSKGTDALRFTLALMTTQTQDVRMPVEFDDTLQVNTSPKFEVGRRLCNKLWNATRFTLGTLSRVEGQGDPNSPPTRLIDRWMLSRLDEAITRFESAIGEYQFSVCAQAFYDLFWRDFCDWYLEGIKGSVREDGVQQSVLRAVLSAIHRMAQPMMPFITESLHLSIESLTVQPHALVQLSSSELALDASWPRFKTPLQSAGVETQFDAVRGLVSAIREVRSAQNVPDKRQITLHVSDDATWVLIESAEQVVETLAGLGVVTRDDPPAAASVVSVDGIEHALSELADELDAEAETERLTRRKEELGKQIGNLNGRLANKKYVDKAPAHLVEETRNQLAESQAELAGVAEALARL